MIITYWSMLIWMINHQMDKYSLLATIIQNWVLITSMTVSNNNLTKKLTIMCSIIIRSITITLIINLLIIALTIILISLLISLILNHPLSIIWSLVKFFNQAILHLKLHIIIHPILIIHPIVIITAKLPHQLNKHYNNINNEKGPLIKLHKNKNFHKVGSINKVEPNNNKTD